MNAHNYRVGQRRSQSLRNGIRCRLAGRISGKGRTGPTTGRTRAAHRRGRIDHHEGTAAILVQNGRKCLRHADQAHNIDIHLTLQCVHKLLILGVVAAVGKGLGQDQNSGIVHHALHILCHPGGLLDAGRVRLVQFQRDDLIRTIFGNQIVQRGESSDASVHLGRAVLEQTLEDGQADASIGAGNQAYFAFDVKRLGHGDSARRFSCPRVSWCYSRGMR
mmetsp:Transcript_28423/g.82213  ORF Transcript_28423/g.82213 Transcript_28423/m.82213 type:complete len:219 (-) Transcript_28423:13-669(-)